MRIIKKYFKNKFILYFIFIFQVSKKKYFYVNKFKLEKFKNVSFNKR